MDTSYLSTIGVRGYDLKLSFDSAFPAITQYIAALEKALASDVSGEEGRLLLSETLFILEQSAQDRMMVGDGPEQAATRAIAEYGDVALMADVHITGTFETQAVTPIERIIGKSNSLAFGVCGCASLAFLFWLLVRTYVPEGMPIALPFSPAQVRSVFPDPLPYPDMSPSFLVTMIYPVLAPIMVGLIVGVNIPLHAAASVYRSLLPIILGSFVAGSMLLPNTEGLLFALWQLIFWLPVGCLAAHLSSLFARRRRHRIWRAASTHPPQTKTTRR